MTTLRDALKLSGGGIISLVGAGGKTSLMGALAEELSEQGQTVLTTTTTRIAKPDDEARQGFIIEEDPQKLIACCHEAVKRYSIVTAVACCNETRDKLSGYPPEVIGNVWEAGLFRWIVVEADGAARKPIKVPAAHEPVIPAESGWVIGLVGLRGVGKPFTDQWVFRTEHFQQVTGLREGDIVSVSAIASALLDSQGVMKGAPAGAKKMIFLNQADDADRINHARRIIFLLAEGSSGIERVVIGRLLPSPLVIDRVDLKR